MPNRTDLTPPAAVIRFAAVCEEAAQQLDVLAANYDYVVPYAEARWVALSQPLRALAALVDEATETATGYHAAGVMHPLNKKLAALINEDPHVAATIAYGNDALSLIIELAAGYTPEEEGK